LSHIDIILLVLLALGAYFGYTKGFLMELVNTASFLLGIFLGIRFWYIGAEYLAQKFDNVPQVLPILGFLFVFVVVLIGVRLIGKVIKIGMDQTLFGSLDKVLGALLGIFKWLIGVGVFLWGMQKYSVLGMDAIIQKSMVCSVVARYIPKLIMLL
jgi:membrane protein required for colicin V production